MVEPAALHSVEAAHKHRGRQLRGAGLWLARAAYIFLFTLVMVFFIVGFRPYLQSWEIGNVGVMASPGANGNLVLYVQPNGDAFIAGIKMGDVLQKINNIPVTSAAEANQLLSGKIGDKITLTVFTGHQLPRTVEMTFAGGFLQLLAQMHLSLKFLVVYNIIFSCLLAAGVILCSPLVFFRRTNDWLVILVAFSMIAFASFLLPPVGYGTQKLHIYFMHILIYMIGIVTMIIVFFLFPTGHFVPRWTRWLSILLLIPAVIDFVNIMTVNNYMLDFVLWIPFMIVGAYAQVFRYKRVSTPVERQQTKRVVLGAVACFAIIAVLDFGSILLVPRLNNAQYVLLTLLVRAGSVLPILILELSFVLAIYRYRLWDTDLYISRTVMYTLVTLLLVLVWVITSQVLNYASQQLLEKQAGWLTAILSSLQVAVIYKPVRNWAERWVNKRFYKDRIDYDKALPELQPAMWTFLSPMDLGHTLVTKVPGLLQSTCAALFLQERGQFSLTEVQGLHPFEANKLQFTAEIHKKLEKGEAVQLPEGGPFRLLVPLNLPRIQLHDVVGVLALGLRTGGRGYSRDHLTDLNSLGRSAGTALHMLQLKEKRLEKELLSGTAARESLGN